MYRTKTYIAGDWTGDSNLIQQIFKWNNSERWALDFDSAHDLTQARDDSLPCSIKRSLASRLDASKTFVLIVGSQTKKAAVSFAAVIMLILSIVQEVTMSITDHTSTMSAKKQQEMTSELLSYTMRRQ